MIPGVAARTTLAVLLLVALGACQDHGEGAASHRGMHAINDSLEMGYERLQRAYEGGDTMAPEIRQLYRSMDQMHSRMRQQHGMGGHMNGPGGMRGRQRQRQTGSARDSLAMREWHEQMMGMHAEMARMHREQGNQSLSQRHQQQEQRHRRMMGALPSRVSGEQRDANGTETDVVLDGSDLFARECAACHGQEGRGIGAFPPLAGSEWVTGEDDRVVRIVLHGLRGPIEVKGRTYDNVMPAFGSRLSDREIAAILSFIRSSWGNEGTSIEAEEVREVRQAHANRARPWSASQLRDDE